MVNYLSKARNFHEGHIRKPNIKMLLLTIFGFTSHLDEPFFVGQFVSSSGYESATHALKQKSRRVVQMWHVPSARIMTGIGNKQKISLRDVL